MNYENIEQKTDKIVENLYNLNNNISKIKRKIGLINKIYSKLEHNKVLRQENKEDLIFFKKLYSAINITESSKKIIRYLNQHTDITKINYFRNFYWKKNQKTKIKKNKLNI